MTQNRATLTKSEEISLAEMIQAVKDQVSQRESLDNALQLIFNNQQAKALNYAINYARHARQMIEDNESLHDLAIQCLYILNNISHWRGPDAKQVRATLKDFVAKNQRRR